MSSGIPNVDRDGLPGGGQRERLSLGLAQERPRAAVRLVRLEVGKLHPIEGNVSLTERLPPLRDHGREQGAVLRGATRVGLTLIPDRPAQREGEDRVNHPVIESGRGVGMPRTLRRSGRPTFKGLAGRLGRVPLRRPPGSGFLVGRRALGMLRQGLGPALADHRKSGIRRE